MTLYPVYRHENRSQNGQLQHGKYRSQWFRLATAKEIRQYISLRFGAGEIEEWDETKSYTPCTGFNDGNCKAISTTDFCVYEAIATSVGSPPVEGANWKLADPIAIDKLTDSRNSDPDKKDYAPSAYGFPVRPAQTFSEDGQQYYEIDYQKWDLVYFPLNPSISPGTLVHAFFNEAVGEWESDAAATAGCVQWAKAKHDWYRGKPGTCSWIVAEILDGCDGVPTGKLIVAKIEERSTFEPNVWIGRNFKVQCDNDTTSPPDDLCGNYTGDEELGYAAIDVHDQPFGSVRMQARSGVSAPRGWAKMGGPGLNGCNEGGSGIRLTEPENTVDDPNSSLEIASGVIYIGYGNPATPQFGRKKMCLSKEELAHEHPVHTDVDSLILKPKCDEFINLFERINNSLVDCDCEDIEPPQNASDLFVTTGGFGVNGCKTGDANKPASMTVGAIAFADSPCAGVGVNSDNDEDWQDKVDDFICSGESYCAQSGLSGTQFCGNINFPNDSSVAVCGPKPGISIQPRVQLLDFEERINNSCNNQPVQLINEDTNEQINVDDVITVEQGDSIVIRVALSDQSPMIGPTYEFELDPVESGTLSFPGSDNVRFTADNSYTGNATLTVTVTGINGCVVVIEVEILVVAP